MRTWRDPVPEHIVDDCKPFIKDEPHSLAKIESNRQRVIMSFSLEDKLVDLLLFGPWIQDEVERPLETIQKAGWSVTPSGYHFLLADMPNEAKCLATDKSAWDWTCPGWVVDYYLECKFGHYDLPESVRNAMKARFAYLYGTGFVFRLPSGERWRQTFYGMMKSGSVLTLSLNSLGQAGMTWLANFRLSLPIQRLWSMGDDVLDYVGLDFPVKDHIAEIRKLGALVKFTARRREFAGMLIRPDYLEPLWQEKHKCILAFTDPVEIPEYLESLLCWYARARAPWFRHLTKSYGITENAWKAALVDEIAINAFFDD